MSVIRSYTDILGPRVFLEATGKYARDIINDLHSFEYSDDVKKPAEVKLTINNEGQKYTDDARFSENSEYKVRWGYPTNMSPLYTVTFARALTTFPKPGGVPSLEIDAWDIRSDMNRKSNAFNWGLVSSSNIAKQIAKRYKLTADVDESNDARSGKSRTQPVATTDIQFLMGLAAKINYDCYIEGTTLYFKKMNLDVPPHLTFRYYTDPVGTLLEFTPQKKNKKAKGGKASANQKDGKGKSHVGHSQVPLGRWKINTPDHRFVGREVQLPSHERDANVAQQHADAVQQKIEMDALEANISVIGTPELTARTIIRLEGVGGALTGNWRVLSSRHVISSKDYIVHAKIARNAVNTGKESADGKPNNKTEQKPNIVKSVRVNTRPPSFGPLVVGYKK